MEELISPPLADEVKRAAWDISADSTPGPDGFTAAFYHSCWDIIEADVVEAVRQFFQGAYLPRSITATSIVLLPKKDNPAAWSDYRPISLCNVSNKIITKILSSRLAPLLPSVIAPNQSGFIKGRLLHDNVLLAQEMFHELYRSKPSPNVALKLDMAKAYDRVQWPFLSKILRRMGFPEAWVSMIERCIGYCWFSVLVNGEPSGFFKSTRGLRQGDPISPALFVIAADYLSRVLDKLILGKKEMVFKSTRACDEVSHLAYADDIIIFTQAAPSSIRRLKVCLEEYAATSGQQINLNKSNFFITENHEEWAASIEIEGGFARGTFPFLYLGVPIYKGVKRTDMFMFLREKIARRITGWAHRHLSYGGRLTVIKSTLEAIPIHVFQAIEPTKGALQILEQQIARFFWGATNEKRRTHWISWEQVFSPTVEGGLGIRRFEDVLQAFTIKLWWRFREQNSLWAKHLYSKYCRRKSPLSSRASGRSSPTWRRLATACPITQPSIRWALGRDLCLDTRGNPSAQVSEYWCNGRWDLSKLSLIQHQAGIPQHIIDEILKVPMLLGGDDTPRWSLSNNGNFTIASAWEKIRARRPIVPALGDLWNKGITATISIFMWRLVSNRIPVDAKLQWRKISLASRCQCCPTRPNIETLQHLFINSQGARQVWNFFDSWFEGEDESLLLGDSIPSRMERWSKWLKQESKSHLSRITPYLIFWFLWSERNNSRHHGTRFRAYSVIWQVQAHIHRLAESGRLRPKHWRAMSAPMPPQVHSRARPISQRVVPVKWHPPDNSWIKMNICGIFAAPPGHASGGGILRDHDGNFVSSFATQFEASSTLDATLMAIEFGLMQVKDKGLPIWVESDTQQAIALINSGAWGLANIRHTMSKIRLLQREFVCKFSVTPKEGNRAALVLAEMGSRLMNPQFPDIRTIPRLLRAIIRLEKNGIPYVRVEEEDGE